MKQLIISLSCVLLLTSCITREQADDRLTRGCVAAVELFIEDGYKIKEIKKSTYKTSQEFGSGYREVMVFAIEYDGWVEIDNEYRCIFAEELKSFGNSHKASIYQVKVNGETYGREGNNILGDMATHLKLTETVNNAMK